MFVFVGVVMENSCLLLGLRLVAGYLLDKKELAYLQLVYMAVDMGYIGYLWILMNMCKLYWACLNTLLKSL
jgi:hypothetical protein